MNLASSASLLSWTSGFGLMLSVGQDPVHWGSAKKPTHSVHRSALITYEDSPSLIAVFGHSV